MFCTSGPCTPAQVKARAVLDDLRGRKILDPLISRFTRTSAAFEAISGRVKNSFHKVDGPESRRVSDGLDVEAELGGGDDPTELVAIAEEVVRVDVDERPWNYFKSNCTLSNCESFLYYVYYVYFRSFQANNTNFITN